MNRYEFKDPELRRLVREYREGMANLKLGHAMRRSGYLIRDQLDPIRLSVTRAAESFQRMTFSAPKLTDFKLAR